MFDIDVVSRATDCFEPLPTSVTRLAVLATRESVDLAQIVDIVRYDPALTAALLRRANSSWSAARTEIATVNDAVVRLGAGPVLALALGVNVRARLEAPVPEYDLHAGDLWQHSVAASLAAEALVRAGAPLPLETPTAALLHDVGKLIMARFTDAPAQASIDVARAAGASRMEAEVCAVGIDHAELGGSIVRAWGLPEALVVGVARHHAPTGAVCPAGPIAPGVHLADAVAKAVGTGSDDNPDAELLARTQRELGITVDRYDDVCAAVSERLAEVSARYA